MANARELIILGSVGGNLGWDMETYLPPKGIMQRSEELGLMSQLGHRMLTATENKQLFSTVEKESLSYVQKRNVHLFRLDYDKATKVPEDLVAAIARQQAISVTTWKKAKAANDWKMFQPELEKLIDLARKRAEIYQEVKGTATLYEALMDEFEPGMTEKTVSKVFGELRGPLVELTKKCAEVSSTIDTCYLDREVPVEAQRKIAADLASVIEYDVSSDESGGRIDETEHPFTTGYYDDVRITVKYHTNNVASMIFAILHEGGHALYEQNLNPEWKYQPLGIASSFGIHESQSRFIENMFGRTKEFWDFYLPKLNEFTNGAFTVTTEDFVRGINLVRPSKIRIEADEVTYSLHVIIRYEIERKLWAGDIEVFELPSVWNEMYKEYLGVDIEDDAEGVMQDTHWASGYFGYFPSYALGNIYGGQMLEKMNKDIPDWLNGVTEGKIGPMKKWLVENVHMKARLYDPGDLIQEITGSGLSAKPFLSYLDNKYSALFGF